jgi:signal transduction histidine kinase/ligand-binding sensor domain-containing protein
MIRSLVILSLLLPNVLFGQQYFFRNINLEHGLPQSQAYDIIQDSRGMIWIATNGGGVCRYWGPGKVEVFNQQDGLIDNHVRRIFEDSGGNLWFGTYYGLSKFDGVSFSNFGSEHGFNECVFLDIREDAVGRIWVYLLHDAGKSSLHLVDNNQLVEVSKIIPSIQSNQLVSELYTSSLFQLRDSSLVIHTKQGFKHVDRDLNVTDWNILSLKDEFQSVRLLYQKRDGSILCHAKHKNGIVQIVEFNELTHTVLPLPTDLTMVNQVLETNSGNLWLAVEQRGMLRLAKDGSIKLFNNTNGFDGADSYFFRLMEDREGSIWVGTSNKGVYQFIDDRFLQFNQADGLTSVDVTAVFKAKNGIGLGLHDGNIYEATTLGIRQLVDGKKFGIGTVKAGVLIGNDLWIGGGNGVFVLRGGVIKTLEWRLPHLDRISHIQVHKGVIWISSNTSGLVRLENGESQHFNVDNSELPSNNVRYVFVDSRGTHWICTNFGLAKVEANGSISRVELPVTNQKVLVFQAAEDAFGNVWFATFGQGLIRYDGNNFTSISTKDGLASDIVYSITVNEHDKFWLSVQNALHSFRTDEAGAIHQLETFGAQNGFLGFEGNGAAIVANNEEVWIGTVKGAYVHQRQPTAEANQITPIIQSVDLFYSSVPWQDQAYKTFYSKLAPWSGIPEELTLPPNQNHITFQIAFDSYRYPASIQLQWKLKGAHNDWTPFSYTREIVYSDLDPGNYVLQLRTRDELGNESDVFDVYTFTLLEPFWRQTWFIALLISTAMLLLILTVRAILRRNYLKKLRELESQQRVQQERQRIARDLHDHVGSQLTYIINGLDDASRSNSLDKQERLPALSEFAREAINQLRETIWATHKESFAIHEFEERLKRLSWMYMQHEGVPQIRVQTDGNLSTSLRPVQVLNLFRIAQEALNNAIKYSQAELITITLSSVANRLMLQIKDNGVGFEKEERNRISGEGFGFSSMVQRVEEIGGELHIRSSKGKGTCIEVHIAAHK